MNSKHHHHSSGTIGLCLLLMAVLTSNPALAARTGDELVILLHGLCRSTGSMQTMADHLHREGYAVHNLDYPSTRMSIEELSELHLGPVIAEADSRYHRIHFVTHSMGGIVVRQYLATHQETRPGRVVMLAPPNSGSELVDLFGRNRLMQKLLGPAFLQLGTSPDSLVNILPAAKREIGIIAGSRSLDPISSFIIKGADDGKVAVSRTPLVDTNNYLILPVSHTFIMQDKRVLNQTVHFLRSGSFITR